MPTTQRPKHPSGKKLNEEEKSYFYNQVAQGNNPFIVGSSMGISRTTTRRLMLKVGERYKSTPVQHLTAKEVASRMSTTAIAIGDHGETVYPEPKLTIEALENKQAVRAWQEFGYHRIRFFNRRHILWQIEMVQIIMAWWEEGQRVKGTVESEFIRGIVNTPPGGGKTTTITHDFPAWVITRNRDVRVGLGARTTAQSARYVRRLRTTFERNPLLNLEYGRFKPLDPEVWRINEFVVDGVTGHSASMAYKLSLAGFDPEDPVVKRRLKDPDDSIHEILDSLGSVFLTGEKEPTVSALSQEMGFLGGRFDLNIWDDLCDKNNSRTPEQRENLADSFWFPEAESRTEPGGLCALVGTRFGKYDLYRHCRDLEYAREDDIDKRLMKEVHSRLTSEQLQEIREDLERELVDKHGKPYGELATPTGKGVSSSRKVYRYYKFPAHDEAKCENQTSLRNTDHIDCVLDPQRFSYLHLMKVRASNPRKFEITYQQNDETTEDNLIQYVWLTGGVGTDGVTYPGCYDYDRRLGEVPRDLDKSKCFSLATVDPSVTNYWSIQWWLWDAESDHDYLIDLLRLRLMAGGFLDWNRSRDEFDGIMEGWQLRSQEKGWPISLWIIEQAAAQRYLFQYRWVKDWMKLRRVLIKGHNTGSNKADPDFGVETLRPRYQQGLVSLPYSQTDLRTRVAVDEFRQELTEWPDSQTEDMVMGHWFLHFNRYTLPDTLRVSKDHSPVQHPHGEIPKYVLSERVIEKPVGQEISVGYRNARLRRGLDNR